MSRSMTSCHRGISAPARQPVRLQLSRRKGFNLQEHSRQVNGLDAVKVDRTTPWGNPFIVGRDGTAEYCVKLFSYLMSAIVCLTSKATVESQTKCNLYIGKNLKKLRGKNLACWCKPGQSCHADVLLELANE